MNSYNARFNYSQSGIGTGGGVVVPIESVYTPVATIDGYINSVTTSPVKYITMGSIVVLSGAVVIDIDGLGNPSFFLSLPVPSPLKSGAGSARLSTGADAGTLLIGSPSTSQFLFKFVVPGPAGVYGVQFNAVYRTDS